MFEFHSSLGEVLGTELVEEFEAFSSSVIKAETIQGIGLTKSS